MNSEFWTATMPYITAALWVANIVVYGSCLWLWQRPERQIATHTTATARAPEFIGWIGAHRYHDIPAQRPPAAPVAVQAGRMHASAPPATVH